MYIIILLVVSHALAFTVGLNFLRILGTMKDPSCLTSKLHSYQVEANYPLGTWQREAYENLANILTAPDKIFPCIYGTKGYKANELDFFFLPSEDLDDLAVAKLAAKAILEYHKALKSRGRNISLVLICPPAESEKVGSVDHYHALFWSLLKRLRQLDPKPWSSTVPHDPLHRRWCMNFDGLEAFFAVLTPAHRARLSRSSPNFTMVYQPRKIFDVVFKDARYRESATKMVRALVDKYDAPLPHSPDISDYGEEGSTESRQYFLLDENVSSESPYVSLQTAAEEDPL
ncbi:YqcI/YcgG family-domain-containing protein [Nemania sp. FL0031]|nr:YqcI/YcgG family-domain-containing protein [Nemania sp. FL0031]